MFQEVFRRRQGGVKILSSAMNYVWPLDICDETMLSTSYWITRRIHSFAYCDSLSHSSQVPNCRCCRG